MSEQFEHELARSVRRIEDAIAPYTRFVRDQRAKLTQIDTDLTAVRNDLRALRHRIGDPDDARPVALPSGTHTAAFPAAEQAAALPAGDNRTTNPDSSEAVVRTERSSDV